MNITKIEKKKRLYLVEFDTAKRLYVTEDTIVHFMLSKGQTLSEQEVEEIEAYAQLSYGKHLALYYLSFRQRTCKEVATYLAKYQIQPEVARQIISRLIEENWLNDSQYVADYLQTNLLSGDKGPRALLYKLRQKGIDKDLIEEQLEGMEFSDLADKVAAKLVNRYEGRLPQRAVKDKVTQQMMGKGFYYEDVQRSLAALDWEKDEETEQELLEKETAKQYRILSRRYEGYDLKQRLIQSLLRKGFDYYDSKAAVADYF